MVTEYGVWDSEAGGFIDTQCWSEDEARESIIREIKLGVDPDEPGGYEAREAELSIRAICPDHEEQPAEGCEQCDTEED